MAATVVGSFNEAVAMVFLGCDKAVVCSVCAFADEVPACCPCGLLACLVVLVRRGLRAAWGELQSLAQPGTAVGHAGRAGARVWSSARTLRPTWHFGRCRTMRVVGHGG